MVMPRDVMVVTKGKLEIVPRSAIVVTKRKGGRYFCVPPALLSEYLCRLADYDLCSVAIDIYNVEPCRNLQ